MAAADNSPQPLAIIGGSSLLASKVFSGLEPVVIRTRFGKCLCHVGPGTTVTQTDVSEKDIDDPARTSVVWPKNGGGRLVFVQRHRADPDSDVNVFPHLINKRAIVEALHLLGCVRVVSFASVGTLRPDWRVGTLVVANDFFHFPGEWFVSPLFVCLPASALAAHTHQMCFPDRRLPDLL
jgi:Phosphorylase superfamily